MTFLSLNGTTIPCASNGTKQEDEEHRVDRERMFDGVLRMSRQGIYRMWSVTTNLLTESDANSILAIVRSNTQPLLASGDLVGDDVAVMSIPGSNDPVQTATGFRRRITFQMKETHGPLPADRTAVPYAFFRRGVGYLTGAWLNAGGGSVDYSGCTAAGDGDLISVWQDQSGNNFHILGGREYTGDGYTSTRAPTLDGTKVRMGLSSSPSQFSRLDNGWWTALTKLDVLIGAQASDGAPTVDGNNELWFLAGSGATGRVAYPAADGHLYDSVARLNVYDLGTPIVDLANLNCYNVTIDLNAASPNWIARLNNVVQYQTTDTDAGFPRFSNFQIGGNASANKYFVGWVRDLVIFNNILTPTQRRSWADYIVGAVADPPLP